MATRKDEAILLPMAMTNLTLAPWETIAHRMALIAQNKCSLSEYERMVSEKNRMAMAARLELMSSYAQTSVASLMYPWLSRAAANAKRLQEK